MNEEWLREELAWINERIDHLEMSTTPRIWKMVGPNGGLWRNIFPWLGSNGNNTWYQDTLVLPLLGAGSIVIGLRWKAVE